MTSARVRRHVKYEDFVAQKRLVAPPVGIDEPPPIDDRLFPFQSDIVKWALRRGRAAIWADCGLGKSWMALEWARVIHAQTGGDILILTPLAVAQQFVREGAKLGLTVAHARTQIDVRPGISVTNYERLHHFDVGAFAGVVADECFARGTEIDTPTGKKSIDAIRVGDRILNAAGIDSVSDVHRREVRYAVVVTINGQAIVCSPSHPFFTARGWVGAQDLVPGDFSLETGAAVRMVRSPVRAEVPGEHVRPILRSILLSEMAHATAGDIGAGSFDRSCGQERRETFGMVDVWFAEGHGGSGKNASDGPSPEVGRHARTHLPPIESHEARTFRAWGQRSWFDAATEDDSECARADLGDGICFVTGPTYSRLSIALQARLGATRAKNRHRGGWKLSPRTEGAGSEEGRQVGFARVDGIEILEQGDPRLERLRSSDGRIYFYDIGGTRHPSFSVAGVLVHNSSILKDYTSSTRNALIESFSRTQFRLACTATPSPNDIMELGNHAEFLGVMSRTEMLSMFFTHDGGDTSKWRLKGHAQKHFWRWVCSWAVSVRKPSDLGYDDTGFALPPMEMQERIVANGQAFARTQGMLFAVEARGLTEQRIARRSSIGDRVKVTSDIVNAEPGESWIVWCDLNDESSALAAAIPGAVEVRGSDSPDAKELAMARFATGEIRVLVSKPSICGWGLNWQHCARSAFVGLSHSFEAWYQAIRRIYRFGQTRPVKCWMISSDAEGAVVANLRRKQADAEKMAIGMIAEMSEFTKADLRATKRDVTEYLPTKPMTIPAWVGIEDAS